MRYVCILCLLVCQLAMCQPTKNTTLGSCSQIINGNRGVVNVNCKDLDPAVAKKLIEITEALSQLGRRAKSDNKTPLMLQRLDEILLRTKMLEASLARPKLAPEALKPLQRFADGKVFTLNFSRDDPDSMALAQEISDQLKNAGWDVAKPFGVPNFTLMSQESTIPDEPPPQPVDYHWLRGGVAIVSINSADEANALSAALSTSGIVNSVHYLTYTPVAPSTRTVKGLNLVVCSK